MILPICLRPLVSEKESPIRLCLIALLVVGCSSNSVVEEPVAEPVTRSIASSEFTEQGHTTDTLDVVQQRVKENQAVLIDVREQKEWDSGHLELANLIPMSQFEAGTLTPEMTEQLSEEKPIYLHCRSGGRVLRVSKLLEDEGYDVRPLSAGYSKLVEAGFEQAAE